ncbi:thiolase family protein [Mycobacterium sp. SMC-4]|uniref:thiolase family protein n=1 Tax=Mycobacterium sp. SMC-4 TaxID=2857059 RepID=UPI0021B1F895|nr:thiolase family protein [Mycobacterium sp. SMC-4]UXA16559.1 thiolase family protein [Mycobacterium sp. SMC-4]
MRTIDAYILGTFATAVGKFPDKDPKALTRDAYLGVLADALVDDPDVIGGAWFANMLMDHWRQPYLKGQLCFVPLVNDGLFPRGAPVTNVEGGCATGSQAFSNALREVQSGHSDVALAIGVEKMFDPDNPRAALRGMEGALDWLDPESWQNLYRRTAAANGTTFDTGPERGVAMDLYGLWAHSHMRAYGTTAEHLAMAAAKNHTNSVHNPRAQYRFPMSVQQVLEDRVVSEPLTRAMCAPIGDGAAAVLVCSRKHLDRCPAEVRERAVRIRANEIACGVFDVSWDDDRAPVLAARRAYRAAGLAPRDIDLVELHDASSFAEIHLLEDLGFCDRGKAGEYTAAGATAIDGELPVNASGGLVSRGHPIGATGLMMLNEIAIQLRGEAGGNAVANARIGLAENGGGVIGNDSAVCSVTILEGPDR